MVFILTLLHYFFLLLFLEGQKSLKKFVFHKTISVITDLFITVFSKILSYRWWLKLHISIPHSLQLKLETSYELLLLLQVVLTCNLIRIQLLVLDGNPSKFPFEANGGEKRRKISGISVKSQQCTHVRHTVGQIPQKCKETSNLM